MFICNARVNNISQQLLDLYQEVCPSTIGHMTDFGFLKGLRPLSEDFHFAGPAVTVKLPPMDGVAIHKALDLVKEGDVLVVDMSGDRERASVGEIVAFAYKHKKVAAIVVDGCITDVRAVKKMGLPIFFRDISPLTTRRLGSEGAINVPVSLCGVVVNPGDLVVGDDDGVFVIEPQYAEEYALKALEKQKGEIALKQRIAAGESLPQINGSADYFK